MSCVCVFVTQDWLYWSDWEDESISKADKFGRDVFSAEHEPTRLLHSLMSPMDLHVFHKLKQPSAPDVCADNNGGCSHLCLPSRYINNRAPALSCACPDDMYVNGQFVHYELAHDGVTCVAGGRHRPSGGGVGVYVTSSPGPEVHVAHSSARDKSKSLPAGAVAAIVIVVLLLVAIIVVLVRPPPFYFYVNNNTFC